MANAEAALLRSLPGLSLAKKLPSSDSDYSKLCKDSNCSIHHNHHLTPQRKSSAVSLKEIETTTPTTSHVDFKSGAIYDGGLRDNLKTGTGVFVWPNGDTYSGEFKSNSRNGLGIIHLSTSFACEFKLISHTAYLN
jgi:hypothetical protein